MDTSPLGHPDPRSVERVDASTTPAAKRPAEGSPGFRQLLERLEASASELRQRTESLERPGDLAGAVDTARASLEDALSVSERLLEAYRQALAAKSPDA